MKKGISLILAALIGLGTIGTGSIKTNAATVPNNATLLNTYGKEFGKIGVAVPAFRLSDKNVMNAIKKDYNSVTAENEMKPDAILGGSPKTMSVSQAKSAGYYIPEGYPESTVPKLNFSTMDNMLKTCYDNGLTMRGHTLVWHSQTPDWFFKSGYNKSSGDVNKTTMDKRMEFFIRNVLGHVATSKYKDVIYCWDVVNEYLHGDTGSNSGWQRIYGKRLRAKAPFVKKAFEYSYDTLKSYKMEDKVKLFYNDYNTYQEVKEVIDLINYVNSDRKVCAGIGMQSHLETKFPTVANYKSALDSFAKAGFEIQITELDVGGGNQGKYCYDLMKAILDSKKAGAKVTAIVWWGLSDDNSWRKNTSPLLYSKLNSPKESYKKVLQAYFDKGYSVGSSNSSKNEKPENTFKNEKPENADKNEKPESADKNEKLENADKNEKPENADKNEKPENTDKNEKSRNTDNNVNSGDNGKTGRTGNSVSNGNNENTSNNENTENGTTENNDALKGVLQYIMDLISKWINGKQ